MRLVFISSVIATTVLRITSAVKASTPALVASSAMLMQFSLCHAHLSLVQFGVNPIDWTAKRRNLEYRSNEFLGLILYSDSLRLAVFLAKEVLGRSSD